MCGGELDDLWESDKIKTTLAESLQQSVWNIKYWNSFQDNSGIGTKTVEAESGNDWFDYLIRSDLNTVPGKWNTVECVNCCWSTLVRIYLPTNIQIEEIWQWSDNNLILDSTGIDNLAKCIQIHKFMMNATLQHWHC